MHDSLEGCCDLIVEILNSQSSPAESPSYPVINPHKFSGEGRHPGKISSFQKITLQN